jgi:hypothetical protein
LLDGTEFIGRLGALEVPMIAFAAFIIVSNLPQPRTAMEQRIFQAVGGWRDRGRNPLEHHFRDRTIVIVDPLVEQQFGLHSS